MVDTLPPWSPGPESCTRAPGAARPYRRVNATLLPISSTKMQLRRSRTFTTLRNFCRCLSSRSVATRLFFAGQRESLQGSANGRPPHRPTPVRHQQDLQFGERDVRLLGNRSPQQRPFGVLPQRRGPPPCHGARSSPARCRRSLFLTNVRPTLNTLAMSAIVSAPCSTAATTRLRSSYG